MSPRLRLPSIRQAGRGRALPWSLFAVAAAAAVATLGLVVVGIAVAMGAGRAIALRRIRESL